MKYILICMLFLAKAIGGTYPDHFRYQILTTDKTTSTVTMGSFISIPHIIAGLAKDEVEDLKVITDWEKPYFTAWANFVDGVYSINFWGGLARIPGMNDEGHALIACHELGHILGGSPKIKIKEFLWSSSEGQSDFYATNTCLKKYFRYLNGLRRLSVPAELSETAFTLCRTTHADDLDFLICAHSMKGIEGFSSALMHLSQYEENLSIATSDRSVVRETLSDSYPSSQCRIDTLVQGALNGKRPLCWFRR